MKMKRVLAVLLALCMILPLAACGEKEETKKTDAPQGGTPTTVVTTVASQDANDPADPTQSGETEESVVTTTVTDESGNVVTTTTVAGGKATTTKRPSKSMISGSTATVKKENAIGEAITIKEGDTPCEAGITSFGGKTFSYAYYGSSWNAEQTWRFDDFQKKYNVKMDIRGLPSGEYVQALSAAMAAGKPYDMVFMHAFTYPSQIVANTMLPLNDYVTTADLWTKESATKGGFSKSLMQAMSLNGDIYCIGGTYLNSPATVYYNKKMFADAGYDGAEDPVALYKAGKWTWEKLYNMLTDIQDTSKGLYGMSSISPYYDHQFLVSYGADLAKLRNDGKLVQNLSDPQLYKAFEMLQKYSYGEHRVTDPKNQFENGKATFLNGTVAAMIGNMGYYGGYIKSMDEKNYSAFGSAAVQKSNIGCVPVPIDNKAGVHPIWYWIGYGVGNGTTEEGVKFALTFAKHDSIYNQVMTWDETMPADLAQMSRNLMDADKLIGPMGGFESSAGSLQGIETGISSKIAIKGNNVTVTLKAYEKVVQNVIDQALKS